MQVLPYLIICSGWIIFYGLHSLLADTQLKNRLWELIPGLKKYYRLLYNIVFTVLFAALLLFTEIYSSQAIWKRTAVTDFLGLMLAAFGTIIIIRTMKVYSLSHFAGIEQLRGDRDQEVLITDRGPLKVVRHPLYAGTLLVLLGFFLYLPTVMHALVVGISICYIYIGTVLEEKKLVKKFGDRYRQYQKNVPMLIPMRKFNA